MHIDPPTLNSSDLPAGSFTEALRDLINTHTIEEGSYTPDYILAAFLRKSLDAFDMATRERDRYLDITPEEYLRQYIEDALRTNPERMEIVFDSKFLAMAIGMFICSGNILDQIKKNIFYKREIDIKAIKKYLWDISSFSDELYNKDASEGLVCHEDNIPVNDFLFHSVIGIATEATELVEALKNGFPDESNVLDEIGDSAWYASLAINELGSSWNEVMEKNIEKLRVRYPEKFTTEHANSRNLEEEKKVFVTS